MKYSYVSSVFDVSKDLDSRYYIDKQIEFLNYQGSKGYKLKSIVTHKNKKLIILERKSWF